MSIQEEAIKRSGIPGLSGIFKIINKLIIFLIILFAIFGLISGFCLFIYNFTILPALWLWIFVIVSIAGIMIVIIGKFIPWLHIIALILAIADIICLVYVIFAFFPVIGSVDIPGLDLSFLQDAITFLTNLMSSSLETLSSVFGTAQQVTGTNLP